jgi:hypothetical protein
VGCCVTSLHILVCWWVVDVSKEVCLQVLCNLVTVTARCAGGEGGWILKCRAWGVISNADVLLLSYNTLAFRCCRLQHARYTHISVMRCTIYIRNVRVQTLNTLCMQLTCDCYKVH